MQEKDQEVMMGEWAIFTRPVKPLSVPELGPPGIGTRNSLVRYTGPMVDERVECCGRHDCGQKR